VLEQDGAASRCDVTAAVFPLSLARGVSPAETNRDSTTNWRWRLAICAFDPRFSSGLLAGHRRRLSPMAAWWQSIRDRHGNSPCLGNRHDTRRCPRRASIPV